MAFLRDRQQKKLFLPFALKIKVVFEMKKIIKENYYEYSRNYTEILTF